MDTSNKTNQMLNSVIHNWRDTYLPQTSSLWLLIPCAAIGVAFVYQLAVALSEIPVLMTRSINDDTFYYLQVAWNLGHGYGPTFDGINLTNGVQPLWAMILSLAAVFSGDKIIFLRVCLILAAVFNLAAGLILVQIGSKRLSKWSLVFLSFVWASFYSKTGLVLSGLEISLNFLTSTLVLAFVASSTWDDVRKAKFSFLALGIFASLFVLTRLDNAIYLPAILTIATIRTYIGQPSAVSGRAKRRLMGKCIALWFVALVLFLAPYLLWNQMNFGSIMPISGQFKSMYNNVWIEKNGWGAIIALWLGTVLRVAMDPVSRLLMADNFGPVASLRFSDWLAMGSLTLALSALFTGLSCRQSGRSSSRIVKRLLLAGAGNLLAILWVWLNPILTARIYINLASILALLTGNIVLASLLSKGNGLKIVCPRSFFPQRLFLAGLLLAIFALFHLTLMVATLTIFVDYGRWYFATEYLTIIVLLAGLLRVAELLLPLPLSKAGRIFLSSLAGLSLVLSFGIRIKHFDDYDPDTEYIARYRAALWISENTANQSIIGSYNAGQVGYFSNRAVVNLDGLVNNGELLTYYKTGRPLTDYLDKKGVQYICDFEAWGQDPRYFMDIPRDRLALVKTFPVSELSIGDIQFFRYLPARSSN